MNSHEPVCGLDVALAVMGGKWKPLILYHLQGGPTRFGAGVLVRRDHQRVPPMVDYTMTPFGLTLAEALMPLCVWGTEHRAEVERAVGAPLSSREQTGAATVERALP